MADGPYFIVPGSERYDLESGVEVYGLEQSDPLGYRLDGQVEVYGVVLSKREIDTVSGIGAAAILWNDATSILWNDSAEIDWNV